jgi:hypothetical protein
MLEHHAKTMERRSGGAKDPNLPSIDTHFAQHAANALKGR